MKTWRVEIEALEDLHVGSGMGRGDIDALQVCDRRGWPVLPASHIKGVLRETALEWQANDGKAFEAAVIDRLFGRAGGGQGALKLTSAYLTESLTCKVWGSTRIDTQTGAAQEDHLRFVEYVPAGARFIGQMSFTGSDEGDEKILSNLLARCTQLGGGRNRGHGRIRWKIDALPAPSYVKLDGLPSSFPARLRLVLQNIDPLCLARTGHPGNIIATEAYLRGRALRGAFIAALIAQGRTDLAQRLLDTDLLWCDALPLPVATLSDADAVRSEVLPIPLSIGTPKASATQGDAPWWAHNDSEHILGGRGEIDQITLPLNERSPEKLKRPGADEFLFRAAPDAPWQRFRPQILQRLHTRVPNHKRNIEQALFSTEEIAENTLFLADLLVADAQHAKALREALKLLSGGWLSVGRGGRPLVIRNALWLDAKRAPESKGSEFILLCESDLIARDANGNFLDRLDAASTAALAGIPDANIEAVRVFSEGTDLFGFNALTGLPRLAEHAIKAGSVIALRGADAQKVRALLAQKNALGELPEEGFGRFRLDALPLVQQPKEDRSAIAEKSVEDPAETLCREARKWVGKFGDTLLEPSASQWGDLRSRIQASRSHDDINGVFEQICAAAKKHGGKAWRGFAEHKNTREFRQSLVKMDFAQAQILLEYFMRWARVSKRSGEAPKDPQ